MEEKEQEELRKKLAEWAELEDPLGLDRIPDFPNDFNACLRFLVPVAIKKFGAMPTYFAACDAMYEAIEKKEFSTKEAPYDGKPALALCLAIESLIDKVE